MNALVSIIIPIYNIKKYLSECLESIINQTYANLDIILVDDGSSDGCADLCDEYALKDRRIRVIHKENGGLSDARNAGLSISEGEYIYFIDGDDYLKLNAIETLLSVMEREKADIVCFEWETKYEDFNDPNYKEVFVRKNTYSTTDGAVMFDLQIKENEFFVPIPIQFYSYDFLIRNKLQFKKGIVHEDELFTPIAFVRADRIACINEQLYCRRLRANSIMSEKVSLRSVDGLIECVLELVDEITNYSRESLEYKLLRKYVQILLFNIFKKYYCLEKKEKKIIVSRIKELRKIISNHGYLRSAKIFFKINLPGIINIYNKIKGE